MKKRIAIFVPSMRGGGAERAMMTLANGLASKKINVDLVLAKAEGTYLNEISSDVNIIDLNKSRVLYALPSFVNYLRVTRPNAVLSTQNHANIVAVIARRISGISTKLVLGQSNTLSVISDETPGFTEKLLPKLVKIFYPYADLIVAVSQGVADDLINYINCSAKKVQVIYDPVVTDELYRKSEEKLDHPWFNDKSFPVILAVGRLTPVKDFNTLIKAFILVRKQISAKLLILGEGECRDELEQIVLDNNLGADIGLPGFVSNPFPYMKHSSLFVLSSRTEGLPNAMIQAMALGLPIVATNCRSGPSEILENGRLGILTEVGNPELLAKSIIRILVNKEYNSNDLIDNCKQRFSAKHIIEKFEKILS
jgi:glycosyltransferase involved in cell wall biosynthesis